MKKFIIYSPEEEKKRSYLLDIMYLKLQAGKGVLEIGSADISSCVFHGI
jgi:hypothetical protein